MALDPRYDPREHWPAQTLTELEGEDWGPPTYPSYVVTNGHALRYKPLRDFTTEDLRFMLGQQISLPTLMPMALDWLELIDPFAGGNMYSGALLENALAVDPQFWRDHPRLWYRMGVVLVGLYHLYERMESTLLPAARAFEAIQPEG